MIESLIRFGRLRCAVLGRAANLALTVSMLVLVGACGGDDDAPTATAHQDPATSKTADPSAVAGGTPTVAPDSLYETGHRSGVPVVDQLMAILDTGEGEKLAARLELLELPCTKQTSADMTDPPCEDGEQEGTRVQVMITASCEFGYLREPQATEYLKAFGETRYRLAFAYDNGSEIRVVVGTGSPIGYRTVFLNDDGSVIGLSSDCGGQLWLPRPGEVTFIVPPP